MNTTQLLSIHQQEGEDQHHDFLASLDPTRTITLRELLNPGSVVLGKLQAPWLNLQLVQKVLGHVEKFFRRVVTPQIPGFGHLPLIFLQNSPLTEDTQELRRRFKRRFLISTEYSGISPAIFYLHTHTNFFPQLKKPKKMPGLVIHPLFHYSNLRESARDQRKRIIVGYRLPNLTQVLQVSSVVATLYLIRNIVHDLGHFFLPHVDSAHEELHNVLMLYAMNMASIAHFPSAWEELIYQECVDPFFFLRFQHHCNNARKQTLTKTQQKILAEYEKMYRDADEYRVGLWEFTPSMSLSERTNQAERIVQDTYLNGFGRYEQTLKFKKIQTT